MRIAFFGLPLAGCLLAHDGHEIALACLSRVEPGRRRLVRLIGEDRVLVRPEVDDALVSRLRAVQPDLVVSWFWTKRLPRAVLELAPHGAFGVHPSLLPRHRGPDPTYWAILSGDARSGVTAHRLADEYDTGAVLAEESLPIDPNWNAWDLARALDRPGLRLLRETVRRFASGEPVLETPQDESKATNAPSPDDDARWIVWARPTDTVVRQIRALAPAPGALTEIGAEVVTLLGVRPVPAPHVLEAPGEAMLSDRGPVIRTIDGALLVESAELDGEAIANEDWEDVFG